MNCQNCGRTLNEDSKFCDQCGQRVIKECEEKVLDTKYLMNGLVISILLTIIVTGAAAAFGLPIFFGALFLPLFWRFKFKDEKK